MRVLHEADPDPEFLEEVVPALERWHRWLHATRTNEDGLVAILHPWEGADNSPRFDAALARVEVDESIAIERTDRRVVAADERPTTSDYVRYRYLVEHLRERGYRPESLEDEPFVFVDLTFNAVLATAEEDLAALWGELGESGGRARDAAQRIRAALSERWDDERALYAEDDVDETGGETIDGLFPLYGGVPSAAQARRLFDEALWAPDRFGPVAGRAVARDLGVQGQSRLRRSTLLARTGLGERQLVPRPRPGAGGARGRGESNWPRSRSSSSRAPGFVEYYEPTTGEPLGARDFSWSAALTIDLLLRPPA